MPLQRAMRLRILLVAAAVVAVGGCGGAQVRYAVHLQRARQFLAQHNLDKASVEARNALQVQPHAIEALDLNGRIEEARGNWRAAAASYQAALDVSRGDQDAQEGLGKIYVMAGSAQRALEVIEPGLRANPANAGLLAIRGTARHLQGDDAAALIDAERAVQLAPRSETAVALLAALYQQTGNVDRALALAEAAVEQAPRSVSLRGLLANVSLAAGRRDRAEEQLRRLVELRPDDLIPRITLAQFLASDGRLDAAQQALEQAVQRLPKDNGAKVALADFIATQRSRAAGETALRKFIETEPDNYDLRLALGALLQRSGASAEAVAAYREIINRDGVGPKGLIARNAIASIEAAAGHVSQAQALIDQVLDKNPRDADALILRAVLELSRNDPTSAIADLRAVLRDQPQSPGLQRTLARAYFAQGNAALAEESLRAAVEGAPTDAAAVVELTQFLARTHRASEAAALLEAGVHRIPDNVALREELVQAYLAKPDLKAAREAAEELKKHKGGEPSGFYLAGLVALQENRLDDSDRELEHALSLKPRNVEVLSALLRVDVARNRGGTSIARISALLQQDPNDVALLNVLGQAYLATRDVARADATLTKAIGVAPTSWTSYRNRARVKLAENDPGAALADYESALQLAPLEPQLLAEAAALAEQHGQIDAAIAHYDALYRNRPAARQLAANNLAMLLVNHRSDPASLDRARDLTAGFAPSENSALLDTYGWVRFKRGEYQEALAALGRAVARAPESSVIRFHLAMAELRVGQKEQARADLEAALARSASFSGSDEARSTLAGLKQQLSNAG